MVGYPVLQFHQYGGGDASDKLILFAAPAKEIAKWAGIPRKGWRIRALYQRWVSVKREGELAEFWGEASKKDVDGGNYILGPSAIIIAVQSKPEIIGDKIFLNYKPPVAMENPDLANLASQLSIKVLPSITARLDTEQVKRISLLKADPFHEKVNINNDYVFEFAIQLLQMGSDCERFFSLNEITNDEQREIVQSLESICRPAIVVDGQHRLVGAARTTANVMLPVVAIPECKWTEQIYQFVVINEKAQRVEPSLLTDIFGSSLTKSEQQALRKRFERAKVGVEERIAAVIAERHETSPFAGMVRFKLKDSPPTGKEPFIPENVIRRLIEGGGGASGWRNDEDFYQYYVQPTFPDEESWGSWTEGKWIEYWFSFWRTVAAWYNDQAKQEGREPLWTSENRTNLTKGVTLKLFQTLFMRKCVEKMKEVEKFKKMLGDLDPLQADTLIAIKVKSAAIPLTTSDFESQIRADFLESGVPVRFFLKTWKTSLDDASGQEELEYEMERAFTSCRDGKRYHAGGGIFVPEKDVSKSKKPSVADD